MIFFELVSMKIAMKIVRINISIKIGTRYEYNSYQVGKLKVVYMCIISMNIISNST